MNRKHQIALFWIAFLATLAILILSSGCTTERKVTQWIEKHPDNEVLDQWITADTGKQKVRIDTVYEPDSIPYYLPGEHIVDSFFVESPCPDAEPLNIAPKTVKTSLATAVVWVENNQLFVDLTQNDSTIQARDDSAKMIINRQEEEIIKLTLRPPAEIKRPWWALPALIIAIFATALLILDLLYRSRRV